MGVRRKREERKEMDESQMCCLWTILSNTGHNLKFKNSHRIKLPWRVNCGGGLVHNLWCWIRCFWAPCVFVQHCQLVIFSAQKHCSSPSSFLHLPHTLPYLWQEKRRCFEENFVTMCMTKKGAECPQFTEGGWDEQLWSWEWSWWEEGGGKGRVREIMIIKLNEKRTIGGIWHCNEID